MSELKGMTAVVTGGTDGIGAATALALCARGARVVIIGRSPDKAAAVIGRSDTGHGGSVTSLTTDLSVMSNVTDVVGRLATMVEGIDVLVHAVGILLTRTEHTVEGLEKDFAVSYLARFAFLEEARERGLLRAGTRMVNISASGPTIPSYARMEFASVDEVMARVGMKSHGQAQLANDLLTAVAPRRYGIVAVGYGPGAVRTQIRREVPALLRAAMAPFFLLTTRRPEDVAAQLLDIITGHELEERAASWFDQKGRFTPDDFVMSSRRQEELLATSLTLLGRADRGGGPS